jgi:threonine dehydrogenase-like Zn-dependent dehydrogenase
VINARVLEVVSPGEPMLVDEPVRAPAEGEILVETLYSGISAGTELTFVKGTNPALRASWDAELGVFRSDRPAAGYPIRRLGYMEVARVLDSRADGTVAGDRVAMTYGHRSHHVAAPAHERVVPLPADIDPLLGIYVAHMGPICANALLHAAAETARGDVELGDGVRGMRVLVTGAGVVGLLVGLFAAVHGAAEVAVADRTPERLAAAAALGLTPVNDGDDAWRWVKERWRHGHGDRGADVVFQCRGRDRALAGALKCCRPQGTVIDLAFYPAGAPELRLGEEFHHNGLAIRCAQIGRVPRGLAHRWSRDRLSRETIALLRAHGDDVRTALISDLIPYQQGPELLLALAARRRHAIQVVLDYTGG